MKGTIKALLLPIGRALPDVDIYGVGNEGEIIALGTVDEIRKMTGTVSGGLETLFLKLIGKD